jgi:SAM-dependent methyltransferase
MTAMQQAHAMMPAVLADEQARQDHALALRMHLYRVFGTSMRSFFEGPVTRQFRKREGHSPRTHVEARQALEATAAYRFWSATMRDAQRQLWDSVADTVDRAAGDMALSYRRMHNAARGSLTLKPELAVPPYLAALDHHCMPGSYHADLGGDDLRAGALYDFGGAMYMRAISTTSGGALNDGRGQSLSGFVFRNWPGFKPRRILDMGCTVGQNTLPLCQHFPDAEIHAIDVGASCLRYAHARAEALGCTVHFTQADAERTGFPDGHFDLVVSQIMMHEMNRPAIDAVFRESHRLLAPGGVVAHLDVPFRFEHMELFDQVGATWEQYHNNETFIEGLCRIDFAKVAASAGFRDLKIGYQKSIRDPAADLTPLLDRPGQDGRYWLVVSGRR